MLYSSIMICNLLLYNKLLNYIKKLLYYIGFDFSNCILKGIKKVLHTEYRDVYLLP